MSRSDEVGPRVHRGRRAWGGASGRTPEVDQGTYWFCDFNQFSLNGAHVYEPYMNATKPSRVR